MSSTSSLRASRTFFSKLPCTNLASNIWGRGGREGGRRGWEREREGGRGGERRGRMEEKEGRQKGEERRKRDEKGRGVTTRLTELSYPPALPTGS